MAIVALTDDCTWHGSAGILTLIADALNRSGRFPEYRHAFSQVEAGWQALDLSKMTVQDLSKARMEIQTLLAQVHANGPAYYGSDAAFWGIVARLSDLVTLLNGVIASTGKLAD